MIGGMTRTSLGQGGKGQTAWKRLDTLTDEDIAQAIASDRTPSSPNRPRRNMPRSYGLTSPRYV
jgi:hypothetical protein